MPGTAHPIYFRADVNPKVLELIEQTVTEDEFELVHCETIGAKQKIVRILVDHPKGVTLDDCSRISRRIGDELDRRNLIPYAYVLEVSSPGVERGLYKASDFKRFAGQRIALRTREPLDGRRAFKGMLKGLDESDAEPCVLLDLPAGRGKAAETISIPFANVEKAQIEVSLDELFRTAEQKSGADS